MPRLALACVSLVSLVLASPLRAADGDLDVTGFHPPDGVAWSQSVPELGLGVDQVTRPIVAPPGDAVVVAYPSDPPGYLVWRVVTPGSLGTPCYVEVDQSFVPVDVALDREGRLLVLGWVFFGGFPFETVNYLVLARFLYPNCVLDDEFDGDGVLVVEDEDYLYPERLALVEVAGPLPGFTFERILIGGTIYDVDGSFGTNLLLIRLRADGSFDSDFGGTGVTTIDIGGSERLRALQVDPQDRILLAGELGNPGVHDAFVTRLQPNGFWDGTFGGTGARVFHQTPLDDQDQVAALVRAAEGDLYLVGTVLRETEADRLAVTRLSGANGATLDSAYWPVAAGALAGGAALQGDGRLIVVGTTPAYDGDLDLFTMAWRTPDLVLDPTYNDLSDFDPLAYLSLDPYFGGRELAAPGMALMHGRPIIAGQAVMSAPSFEGFAFVGRLESSYIFADSFESGNRSAWR